MSKFGTKAYNLRTLATYNIDAIILDMYIFSVDDWYINEKKCLDDIIRAFNSNVIIRSSAYGEDVAQGKTAGKYKSEVNVPLEYDKLKKSIEIVINSYGSIGGEVLVQPYLPNTQKSGVVFTYDINNDIPYYIVEISETCDTSAVTGGTTNSNKIYRIAREAELYNELGYIIRVSRQIEKIYDCEFLDIEFAIDEAGNIIIFQVRQLYCSTDDSNKKAGQMLGLRDISFSSLKFDSNYSGNITLLSNMTDWNPAELIGKHPYPLDYSLYNTTFTKDTWLIGRERIGYKKNSISSLTQLVNGFAYVNVQKDFNSYLPRGLSGNIENKLIDFYVKMLDSRKELYDKAEFEIVDTCYTVQMDKKKYSSILNDEECNYFFGCLKKLTNNIILDKEGVLHTSIEDFEIKQNEFLVLQGLEYCLEYLREYGIIYSSIVRSAFVAYEELLSLNELGLLSAKERDLVMNSINSITSQQIHDIENYKNGKINKDELVKKYRHIREDMFNILSISKYECEEFYDSLLLQCVNNIDNKGGIHIQRDKEINELLKDCGLNFTIQKLISFNQKMFEYREKVKYQIGVVLTEIYREIKSISNECDIPLEDMRFATIEDIVYRKNELKKIVNASKEIYTIQDLCIFPDVIKCRDDFYVVEQMNNRPNYITNSIVEADIICLDNYNGSFAEMKSKIVLIKRADPGFDWIFGMGIVGVVTCYGGVASHMAIRAYEMALPAIIGCGETRYAEIKKKRRMIINCEKNEYVCI